jgi:hypothetical protein
VFPARYELNSYIVFRKRLVSKRLSDGTIVSVLYAFIIAWSSETRTCTTSGMQGVTG